MLHLLRRHPLPICAFFDYSAVLTFALPADTLRPLLPPGLELDEREGLGFVAIAMVKTRNLRPAFFPAWLGQDFFLTGYRIFTRLRTQSGRRLRGLRILQSQTDKRRMVWSGNLLTHYNYSYAPIESKDDGNRIRVRCADDLAVEFRTPENAVLPATSVFADWREARMYAGPLPFTFDYEKESHSMVVIEGVRENWTPQPAEAQIETLRFFEGQAFRGAEVRYCSAFVVRQIPYRWKRGWRAPLDA